MSRTLHLFGTDWCAMMVPIHALQWYRFADTVTKQKACIEVYLPKRNIRNYIPVNQRNTNYSANKGIDTV